MRGARGCRATHVLPITPASLRRASGSQSYHGPAANRSMRRRDSAKHWLWRGPVTRGTAPTRGGPRHRWTGLNRLARFSLCPMYCAWRFCRLNVRGRGGMGAEPCAKPEPSRGSLEYALAVFHALRPPGKFSPHTPAGARAGEKRSSCCMHAGLPWGGSGMRTQVPSTCSGSTQVSHLRRLSITWPARALIAGRAIREQGLRTRRQRRAQQRGPSETE